MYRIHCNMHDGLLVFQMGINCIHNVPLSVVFGYLCQQISVVHVVRRKMVMKSCNEENVKTGKMNNKYIVEVL